MTSAPDPRRRNPRTQQAILTAARELCDERGYGNVTIEAIAARATVGKQTIYRWWPSKGAILFDVFMQTLKGAVDIEPAADLRTSMRNRLRALVGELRKKQIGPHIAALLAETQTDGHLAQQWQERLARPARTQHLELITKAQADGQIRADVDANALADLLFGPIWLRLLVTHDPLSYAHVDQILDIVMRGAQPRGR
jgi:AcrR family transcriptional regulator